MRRGRQRWAQEAAFLIILKVVHARLLLVCTPGPRSSAVPPKGGEGLAAPQLGATLGDLRVPFGRSVLWHHHHRRRRHRRCGAAGGVEKVHQNESLSLSKPNCHGATE